MDIALEALVATLLVEKYSYFHYLKVVLFIIKFTIEAVHFLQESHGGDAAFIVLNDIVTSKDPKDLLLHPNEKYQCDGLLKKKIEIVAASDIKKKISQSVVKKSLFPTTFTGMEVDLQSSDDYFSSNDFIEGTAGATEVVFGSTPSNFLSAHTSVSSSNSQPANMSMEDNKTSSSVISSLPSNPKPMKDL